MENLLLPEERICSDCCDTLGFRLSRFGCLYCCSCSGKFLDFFKVLSKYISSLEHGFNSFTCVPCISTESSLGTIMLRVVQIELNFFTRCLLLSFQKFSPKEREEVCSMFSLTLQEYLSTSSIPVGMIDLVLEELENISNSFQFKFFISPPSKNLLEACHISPCRQEITNVKAMLTHSLANALRPHQLLGVEKILQIGCRALIADEMGVGKTLEAIGAVAAIRGYPLLIVAPSALKLMWAEEIERYLFEQVAVDEIHLVKSANDALPEHSVSVKVVIISYHMVSILQGMVLCRHWKCLVCDEAHFLHTNMNDRDATYTTTVCLLAKKADYCLFLTGTPATNSPFDMYNILDAIAPNFFGKSRWEFALRFCRLHFNPHAKVMECTRKTEFSSLLHQRFMVRRHKEEILDLPEKWRTVLRVSDPEATYRACPIRHFQNSYAEAWQYKWDGIAETILFCLSKFFSVVCFAHHRLLLDRIEKFLVHKGISFIRIDGSVDPNFRQSLLECFRCGKARVAVMGITACAVGVSLVSAESAVFCELPPDAAWMAQAEDRLHRPGQKRNVSIYYVVGVHSAFDERHFNRLRRSFQSGREAIKRSDNEVLAPEERSPICLFPSFSSFFLHEKAREEVQKGTAGEGKSISAYHIFEKGWIAWFTISRHTGRIHIGITTSVPSPSENSSPRPSVTSNSSALDFRFYTSMAPEEAIDCIRLRSVPCWVKLDEFLTSFWSLSPYQRRMFLQIGRHRRKENKGDEGQPHRCVWWASGPILSIKTPYAVKRKTNRYSEKEDCVANRGQQSWSCWIAVPPRSRGTGKYIYYLDPLVYDLFTFMPTCLNCGSVLAERNHRIPQAAGSNPSVLDSDAKINEFVPVEHSSVYFPGAIVKAQSDSFHFCDGQCREDFFVKKSSNSIRHTIKRADYGVCNACHIDCEKLRVELLSVSYPCASRASCSGWTWRGNDSVLEARRGIVERCHPLFMQFPHLVERLIRNPLPGHLWHADHIVPVSHGGGECTVDNLQTLCVACHQLKTQEDMKRLKKRRRTEAAFASNDSRSSLPSGSPLTEEWLNFSNATHGIADSDMKEMFSTRRAARRVYRIIELCENRLDDLEFNGIVTPQRRIHSF